MDADEPIRKAKPHEVGMAIDTMSAGELRERIGLLEAEISRLKDAITAREKTKAAADSLFKL